MPDYQVKVEMGRSWTGFPRIWRKFDATRAFKVKDAKSCDVVKVLKDSGAEMLINYLPVGSEEPVFMRRLAWKPGSVLLMPCPFLSLPTRSGKKFRRRKIPIIGDDVKSQVGATIVHRVLTNL